MHPFAYLLSPETGAARTKNRKTLAGFLLLLMLTAFASGAGSAPNAAPTLSNAPLSGHQRVAPVPAIDSAKSRIGDSAAASGDSVKASARPKDSIGASTTAPTQAPVKKPAGSAAADTALTNPKDSFDVHSAIILGAGAGLSLGSNPVFSMWERNLPASLADFGSPATQQNQTSNPLLALTFSARETPDIYNMMFPITLSISRLLPEYRYGITGAFSMASKVSKSAIIEGPDSLHRHIDISQGLDIYAFAFDVVYGRRIPERYFSIDGVDRTDIIVGASASPFIALKKSSSVTASASDSILSAAKDSAVARQSAFSSSGIALGWRVGFLTVRRVSRVSGIEAGVSYYGLWSTRFRTNQGPLVEKEVNAVSTNPSKEVSYFSSRVEITVSLIHKIF